MRIQHIRLKNLNSLAGEWCIDLTHPAYVADGIFAITGPTGAGKTTLLDAICLALYGRTPRLARVGKGGNEVMSRQSGECFAEVTFETPAGRFRCHWSQHRARRKPGGELQTPRHEIAQADGETGEGQVIDASLRGVAERVEAITGMDFERFTRSMLLAQGGFAAFLQATPDERSPLLEQITGTEIYSRISMQVHERRSAERARLAELQAALNGLVPLAPDEVRQLAQSLGEKTEADAALAARIAQGAQAMQWQQGLEKLTQELERLAQAQAALQAQAAAFAPEQARLHAAGQALELAAEHAALRALRQADQADAQALVDVRASLPACEKTLHEAEAAQAAASQRLNDARTEQQAAQPLLREVRALDLKMAEQARPLAELDKAIATQSAQLDALQAQQRQGESERGARQTDLAALQSQLAQTHADAQLVENLAALRDRFESLARLQAEEHGLAQAVEEAERALAQAADRRQTQAAALAQARAALHQQHAALTTQTTALNDLLQGRPLADWRRQHAGQQAHQAVLARAIEALHARAQATQALLALGQRRQALEADGAAQAQTLDRLAERQHALATERDLLETQLDLLQRIEDLESARHRLRDGQPCPLCGALDHPYARGNVPVPDATRERLAQLRAELNQAARALSDAQVQQARIAKDLELASAQQAQHAQAQADAEAGLNAACAQLPMDWVLGDDAELASRLDTAHADGERRMAHIAQVLDEADALEHALATLRSRLDEAKEAAARAEREELAAAHAHQSAAQTLAQRREAVHGLEQRLQQMLGELQDAVRPYGINPQAPDALARLSARRDRWLERRGRCDALARELAELTQQLDFQARQIAQSGQSLERLRAQRDAMRQALDRLAQQRQSLFADRQPDDEEGRLAKAVAQAETVLEAARQRHTQARLVLTQCQDRQAALAQSLAAREPALQAAEQDFAARLQACGFADEAAYRQACLPEHERHRLAEQARQLAQAQASLAEQQQDKTALLASERARQLTEATPQELNRQQDALIAEQRALQQAIGAIAQKLRDNDVLLQRQQAQVAAVEAQQRECARWDQLHELIGSADGKKYRNFAQGLTFEMVVRHANRQLRKMSDRYLLVRDAALPLELNVIDNDQAGEVRSTKNLSGGECFIVSLALALGLSQMASRNVRVDSLFLDEGFGTLDEDALDTALDTLAGLQQEGKLIGVISHVPALKERIGTQIQVMPVSGGKSRLSGPGCSAV